MKRKRHKVHASVVVLRLTRPQLDALGRMVSNCADHPDAMEALFTDGASRRAGHNAAQVVFDAWGESLRLRRDAAKGGQG